MIAIMECARKIEKFLKAKGEERFKIFIRLQMQLDVFVFSERVEAAKLYYDEFIKELDGEESSGKEKYKISFEVVSPEEEQEDPYYASVAANLNDKIDYGPRYRLNALISLPKERNSLKNLPPIVTFYSYKGGMGRTTTLASYAMDLAYNHKKNVVIVDCDLEAPGYLNFFSLYDHPDLLQAKKNGFVEFICDSKFCGNDIDITKYLIQVPVNPKEPKKDDDDDDDPYWLRPSDGKIWVLPAGNLNEGCLDENIIDKNNLWEHKNDYLEGLGKLNSIDSQSLKNVFLNLFNKLKESEKVNPDIILVDSRTGFNDIFGMLAFNLSSYVVGFFGRSRQTEPGFINLLTTHLELKKKAELKKEPPLKLQLVYSILPDGTNGGSPRMQDLMGRLYPNDPPDTTSLHRNNLLERIGCEDGNADNEYKKSIRNISSSDELGDYREIFENINRSVFPTEYHDIKPITASEARIKILRYLKNVLDGVKDCAEDSKIDVNKFFFRSCMKDLFLPEKFIIQGYKGTGKTCLYKALADDNVSPKMQEWAKDECPFKRIFLKILPEKETGYPFKAVDISKIQDPDTYFRGLWEFITWNILLLNDDNEQLNVVRNAIRESSELKDYVQEISERGTLATFNHLYEQDDALLLVERDLKRFDKELEKNEKSLIILYDRLDSFVPALKWDKIVSPLIRFWRDYHSDYNNIVPKIFIRTDLLRQTKDVNPVRLTKNIISIEWSIAEVFAYFFKLIFSDSNVGELFWEFSRQLGLDNQYIESIKKNFDKNFNQFKSLNEAEMVPVVQAFFGRDVSYNGKSYGKPWTYFENELANADRNSISLRPFVNLMKESISQVNLNPPKAEYSEILSSNIYADDKVRQKAAEMNYDDIIKDPTAADLEIFKEVVTHNPWYRFKSLPEDRFNDLITEVYDKIQSKKIGDRVVEDQSKLKELIFANGIMAKKNTTRGLFYAYAPIYCFAWKLKDSFAENEETDNHGNTSKSAMKDRLVGVLKVNTKQQPYVSVTIGQGNEQKEFRYEVREKLPQECEIGDLVSFKINEVPHKTKANSVFRIAVGLRKVNQDVLNEKAYDTTVVLNEWAVANNVKAKNVVELLKKNGVKVEKPTSRVSFSDIEKIRSKLFPPLRVQVFKPDDAMLERIRKSQKKSSTLKNGNRPTFKVSLVRAKSHSDTRGKSYSETQKSFFGTNNDIQNGERGKSSWLSSFFAKLIAIFTKKLW